MLIFFTKSQLALFDSPIHVGAHVRKDGTVVKPHIRIQKVAVKQRSLFNEPTAAEAPAKRPRGKLQSFMARHGGPEGLASTIRGFNEQQQRALLEQMAKVGEVDVAHVRKLLGLDEGDGYAAPAAQAERDPLATGIEPQKGGAVLVLGDPEKLVEFGVAHLDLGLVKFRRAENGIVLPKSKAEMAEFFPSEREKLSSGAYINHYPNGHASLSHGKEVTGIARSVDDLKEILAADWGPEKFQAVFGERASDESTQAYAETQAEIARRKKDAEEKAKKDAADAEQAKIDAKAKADADKAAQDKASAEAEAKRKAEIEATLHQGHALGNDRYQAFLDTLEDPSSIGYSHGAYMGFINRMSSQFEAKHGPINTDEQQNQFTQFVREYAEAHLSDRVKAERGAQAADEGPKEGDRNAEGLIFRDGRWHREDEQATASALSMPDFQEGKNTTGVKDYYEKVAQQAIDMAAAGDVAGLEAMKAKGLKPSAKTGKVSNTWAGKTANSKLMLDLHARALAMAGGKADDASKPASEIDASTKPVDAAPARDPIAARAAQAAKLRAGGEKLLEDSEAEYGRDRNTNTARRARMAASAEAAAAEQIRIAKTMINLADAMDAGELVHLNGLNTKAAVQTIDGEVKRAIMETDRKLSYADQQRNRGRDVTDEDIGNAKFPAPKWGSGGTSLSEVLDAVKGKRGSKEFVAKYRYSSGPTPDMAVALRKLVDADKVKRLLGWWNIERLADMNRLQKLGITNTEQLQAAMREYVQYRGGLKVADPVKVAERALVGQKVGIDFFPTPKTLAASMAEAAGIKAGMRVLEPSAGNGHLADAAKAAGADVDTVEISDTLRNILQAKGHNLAGRDFETFEPAVKYDAVLMNPPFSNRQDAAHIMRAWDMVKPGGKLVAIAGEGVFFGSDAKAKVFRDWLAEHGAEVEPLPAGTFMGADLPAQTGTNARLIKITKMVEQQAAPIEDGPREGDVNAKGLVFRNGRWHREGDLGAEASPAKRPLTPDAEAVNLARKVMGSKFDADHKDYNEVIRLARENGIPHERLFFGADSASARSVVDHVSDENLSRASAEKIQKKIDTLRGKVDASLARTVENFDPTAIGGSGAAGRQRDRARASESRNIISNLVDRLQAELDRRAELQPTETDLAEDREDLATEMMRNPHSDKAKALLAAAAEKHAKADTPTEGDENDPSSPNYRFADTGYIAGARKEEAASLVIQRAKRDGAQVLVQSIDWEGLEQNPREAKELITKSNLFGQVPWDHLREQGMEPAAGFLVDRVYAAVGQEPGEDNAQARRDYTLGLQTLRTRLESCKTPQQVLDTLDELRTEYDGKVLNAEESAAYQRAQEALDPLYKRMREVSRESDKARDAYYASIQEYRDLTSQQDKRIRRGWKPDPEIAKRIEELRPAADGAQKDWVDGQQRRHEEEKGLREQMTAIHRLTERINLTAYARNKIDNPLHRAWNIMGERFVNVLRYRSYKGSEAFQKHVTAAKNGMITDWSWADKGGETKTPRVKKESARFQMKVAERYERKGGRSVDVNSTMALKAHFGLRDVQSGNWVLQDPVAAKFHVEHCAEAFADLADLLGVPDELVSFKGRLAMSFGARGKGNAGFGGAAAAHYDDVHRVINLTKMSGGGALAHEWFHAIDNLVKEAEGAGASGSDDYVTERPTLLPPGPLRDAFVGLREAMMTGEHQATNTFQYTAQDYRLAKHNLERQYLGGVALSIKNAKDVGEALQRIAEYYEPRMGARGAKKQRSTWESIAIAWHGGNPDGGELKAKSGPKMSSFMLEANFLDGGSKKTYYAQVKEMAARAFQGWVEDRMGEMGRKNDYLSSFADNKYHVDPIFGIEWKPFPEGEERERINKAFDNLMAAMGASGTLAKALAMMEAGGV